jgi:hypothetical protein
MYFLAFSEGKETVPKERWKRDKISFPEGRRPSVKGVVCAAD